MNSKLFMLGILLLAGISFARIETNWMMYSADKYGCTEYYNGYGWGDDLPMGLSDVVLIHNGACLGGCWDTDSLVEYRIEMSNAIWDDGPCMCADSGCPGWGGRPDPVLFRSSVLEFNAAAMGFKSEFLAGVRRFIAAEGSGAAIFADLATARDDYADCLSYMSEEGPCYMCSDV